MALGTSAGRPHTHGTLTCVGCTEAVREVVTTEDVRLGKPEPDGHPLAVRRPGIEPMADIVVDHFKDLAPLR